MRIDWMKVGEEWVPVEERERILSIIEGLEWIVPIDGMHLPILPSENIQEAIRQLRIPKVDLISYSCNELAPFGFYGIQGNYKNGRAQIFILDCGDKLTPVCAKFFSNQVLVAEED